MTTEGKKEGGEATGFRPTERALAIVRRARECLAELSPLQPTLAQLRAAREAIYDLRKLERGVGWIEKDACVVAGVALPPGRGALLVKVLRAAYVAADYSSGADPTSALADLTDAVREFRGRPTTLGEPIDPVRDLLGEPPRLLPAAGAGGLDLPPANTSHLVTCPACGYMLGGTWVGDARRCAHCGRLVQVVQVGEQGALEAVCRACHSVRPICCSLRLKKGGVASFRTGKVVEIGNRVVVNATCDGCCSSRLVAQDKLAAARLGLTDAQLAAIARGREPAAESRELLKSCPSCGASYPCDDGMGWTAARCARCGKTSALGRDDRAVMCIACGRDEVVCCSDLNARGPRDAYVEPRCRGCCEVHGRAAASAPAAGGGGAGGAYRGGRVEEFSLAGGREAKVVGAGEAKVTGAGGGPDHSGPIAFLAREVPPGETPRIPLPGELRRCVRCGIIWRQKPIVSPAGWIDFCPTCAGEFSRGFLE